jgi:hypothetical protein
MDTNIEQMEARLVAHGIVLQAIARLLPESTRDELRAAASSVDDEGMQEANPDPRLRDIAAVLRSILEIV